MKRRDFLDKALKTSLAVSSFPYILKAKSPKVKIGYIPITDAAPLLIAYANNFFKEQGLEVEKPVLLRTWSALVEAFLSGKVNLVHLLIPIPIWMRYKNNNPVKMIAWDHLNGSALTVAGNSGIHRFEDLGGKKIAVPYWYSMHNIILQYSLRKVGIEPVIHTPKSQLKKNQVSLTIMAPPEMPTALAGKKIDGFIVAEPFNAFAELRLKAKVLRFTGDIWKNHPCCVVVMNENLIKDNPLFTQKVVNSVVLAQNWMNNNRIKSAEILSREGKRLLPADFNTLKRVFTHYDIKEYHQSRVDAPAIKHLDWNINRIDFHPFPYPSATQFIYEQMKQTVVEGDKSFLFEHKADFVMNDLADDQFVKKAILETGVFEELLNHEPRWERIEEIEL